jgi:hypothetical protein
VMEKRRAQKRGEVLGPGLPKLTVRTGIGPAASSRAPEHFQPGRLLPAPFDPFKRVLSAVAPLGPSSKI